MSQRTIVSAIRAAKSALRRAPQSSELYQLSLRPWRHCRHLRGRHASACVLRAITDGRGSDTAPLPQTVCYLARQCVYQTLTTHPHASRLLADETWVVRHRRP